MSTSMLGSPDLGDESELDRILSVKSSKTHASANPALT